MSNEEKCCHDHEHEHHHDHDEECHCHDHDHHHEHHHNHDEECHCHDHEHDHDHVHDEISIVSHEGALAGSFSLDVNKSVNELNSIIKEAMNLIKVYIDFKEGVIGHIKAAITKDNEAVMYSLTLDEISTTGAIKGNVAEKVNFAAIVYGADEDALYALLTEIKEKLED